MKTFTCFLTLALFGVLFGAVSASAEVIPPTHNASTNLRVEVSRQKSCTFVTHDCELCIRSDDDRISCSSVGFACQPKAWRCLESTNSNADNQLNKGIAHP